MGRECDLPAALCRVNPMETDPMVTFTNPRLRAEIENYPVGFNRRGLCVFEIECNANRYRIRRTTTGKPKLTTYGGRAAIVDGDNGKTYILQVAGMYEFITVWASSLLNADPKDIGRESACFKDREPEAYQRLLTIIDSAYGT